MRLHENNNEEDELQRLRARRRTEADVLYPELQNLHHSEQNLGQPTDRQEL